MELNQAATEDQEIEDNKKAVEVVWKSFANHKIIKTMKESHTEKNLMAGNNHIQDVWLRFSTTFRKYW